MDIAIFDTHRYDRESLERANVRHGHTLHFLEPRLTADTAMLAHGCRAACSFVNDRVDAHALTTLREAGVSLLLLRCAGFNHVDLNAADANGITVTRVPEYSPYAVAEHAAALLLTLVRKIHKAHVRVRENNFALDGLVGFDLHGRTVGVVGTGRIGKAFAQIARGFGCTVLASDPVPDADFARAHGITYVPFDTLLGASDIVSLHSPLTPDTQHLIDRTAVAKMKPGVVLINTSRGGLIDTEALLHGLKSGRIGSAGLDVYEKEAGIFFQDLSDRALEDEQLARLQTFPNVLITAHQAFLTREALDNIAETTLSSATLVQGGSVPDTVVRTDGLPKCLPVRG